MTHLSAVALLSSLLATSTALAEFKPMPNDKSAQAVCTPKLDRKDSDPVIRTFIGLKFDSATGEAVSLGVVHHTFNGNSYDRSDQYRQTGFSADCYLSPASANVSVCGKVLWRGFQKQRPQHQVVGVFHYDGDDGQWHYDESHYTDGALDFRLTSRCEISNSSASE